VPLALIALVIRKILLVLMMMAVSVRVIAAAVGRVAADAVVAMLMLAMTLLWHLYMLLETVTQTWSS
jgi:hypothetical protein